MNEFKVGDVVYLNGNMEGRIFENTRGVIRDIQRSFVSNDKNIYDISYDNESKSWLVWKSLLSHKPLYSKEIELAGITGFWKKNGIK